MSDAYNQWYTEFQDVMQQFDEDALFASLSTLLHHSRNTFAMNRKLMQKAIDVSWVEAIENGLVHVDNFLRNPRRTIEDVEEIVPIALSRKITVESVKHLAQHTDFIQSVDQKTGKITPSKILNVHKEESLMTYENKFVNTLIDRLYLFINIRYEKLVQVAKDEQAYTLDYDTTMEDGVGGKMKIAVKIETVSSLDSYDESGYTVWQRVEKLKKVIEGYKGSELCTALGNTYIRPPVMRTNAIMKNVDLKACLTLWQYIESYDKAGYEINIEDSAVQPDGAYVENFYRLVMMHMLLFRSQTGDHEKQITLKTNKRKPVQPKFLRRFDRELSDDYTVTVSGAAGYIASDGEQKITRKMPRDVAAVFDQIGAAIAIEQAYQAECEEKRIAKRIAEEKEALRIAEQERIETTRKAEQERLEQQREEEEKRLQEMLAQKRAEQEAAARERERQEKERLALLEEKRKREEAERLRREEEERIQNERQRLADERNLVRSELGEAEGVDTETLPEKPETNLDEVQVTEEEIEEVKAAFAMDEERQFEDPREVAARMKLEQQRREKERAEKEHAEQLKAQRQYYESKPFREIYEEYTWNPIYAIPRLIKYLLAILFGLIPEDTDNPDLRKRLAAMTEKRRLEEIEKQKQFEMETYYRKYAQSFKYRFLRDIADIRFKMKRAKKLKNKPLPQYEEPFRTEEQKIALQQEMQRLYREYHVSRFEKLRRWWREVKRHYASS